MKTETDTFVIRGKSPRKTVIVRLDTHSLRTHKQDVTETQTSNLILALSILTGEGKGKDADGQRTHLDTEIHRAHAGHTRAFAAHTDICKSTLCWATRQVTGTQSHVESTTVVLS